jgi:hypothetical protein
MGNQRTSDRRRDSERRLSSDRRRGADDRHALFELCRSKLNFALVVKSGETEKLITRSLHWRNTSPNMHTEQGARELTEAFRKLVSDERLAGAKVRIALGGEFCVTRVVTGPTDEVHREFAGLEERSLRYLTLGPGRKSLSRCLQQLDARHQHAMLTVTSQRTLDLLLQIAADVGIQIESVEPSLIALSRAQSKLRDGCRDACLLIQLDEGTAELGICHRGRLLLDYRPGGNAGPENIEDVVRQHLFRLQRYLNRYHSYITKPLQHVYLSGDPRAVEVARQKFERLGELEVHVLNPADLDVQWEYAGEAPGTEAAAVLGSALALDPNMELLPGPNLIEGALAELRTPLRPILVRSLAPLAAVLLAAVTLFALHLFSLRQISGIQSELIALDPIVTRANEWRLQLMASEAKLAQLTQMERKLGHPDWQKLLVRVSQCMPEDVWLDRLVVRDGHFATFGGASFTDSGVYDFVNNLKSMPDVKDVALEGTGVSQNETGPTTTFDLKATLANFTGDKIREGHDE